MVIFYILIPLISSTVINALIVMIAQTYMPVLAQNMTLLTGICGLVTIPVMVLLDRCDAGKSMLERSWVNPMRVQKTERRAYGQESSFWTRQSYVRKIILLTGAIILGVLCSLLEGWLIRVSGAADSSAYDTVGTFFQAKVWMQIIFLGVVAPVAEELTFRGVLTKRLLRFAAPPVVIVLSALLFAVGHGNLLQALYAFPMGLLLGAVRIYGGSLSLPIAMHMGANLISVLVGVLG